MRLAEATDSTILKWQDEVYSRLYTGGHTPAAQKAADAHIAEQFHQQAEQVPDWQRLLFQCKGDALASAVATEAMANAMTPALKAALIPKPKPQQQQPQQQPRLGGPKGGAMAALQRAKAGGGDEAERMRRQILVAAQSAAQQVDDTQEALAGLAGVGGWLPGDHDGTHTGNVNAEQVHRLLKMLKDNDRIKRISQLAGRFKRIAASKRRHRSDDVQSEVIGVEQGADLARLLPSELSQLHHPSLRRVFMRDLLEQSLMQYRLSGKQEQGRGPVVVCIDKSGSMEGDRDEWATAVALAVLAEAANERRPFALICFDHGILSKHVVEAGGSLPMEALMVKANGGTDIKLAVNTALSIIESHKGSDISKADIIVITDGGDVATDEERKGIMNRAEAADTTIYGIGIGVARQFMEPWCNEAYCIHNLNTIEDAAAEAIFAAPHEV
jgi:Mg-chelatase subunit ChlD